MLASSRDPYGVGFREVEIVEEDKDTFGKYASPKYNPEWHREYHQRIKGTDMHERRKACWRRRGAKERLSGYNRGHEWAKANRLRDNERRRKHNKESGRNERAYLKYGQMINDTLQQAGYRRIAAYLCRRKISTPKNFTYALTDYPWLKKGQWAWTFAHP